MQSDLQSIKLYSRFSYLLFCGHVHTENTHVRITNFAHWSPHQKCVEAIVLHFWLPHKSLTRFYFYPIVNNFRNEGYKNLENKTILLYENLKPFYWSYYLFKLSYM